MPYAPSPTALPDAKSPRKKFTRFVASIVTVALLTLGLGVSPAFADVAEEESAGIKAPAIAEMALQSLDSSEVEESPASSTGDPIDVVIGEADADAAKGANAGENATETKGTLVQEQPASQKPEVSKRKIGPAAATSYYEVGSISGRVKASIPPEWNYEDVNISVTLVDAADKTNEIDWTYPDSEGQYTFDNVEPGDYKVQFSDSGNYYFIEQWWSNQPDFKSAKVVSVQSGESIKNIDATLASRQATISGVVDTPDGTGRNDIYVILVNAEDETDTLHMAFADREGRYTFYNVEPGRYKIQFTTYNEDIVEQWWDNRPNFKSAKIIIVQSGDSVENVNATLKKPLRTSTPTIAGTMKVGSTLTAKPGTWTSGTTFKYQWYRNGKAISKATSTKYKLVASDAGKQISVKVTGTKSGYNSASKTSAKTTTIAKKTLTFTQKQAVDSGKSYLKYVPGFSRQGLIDQLVYENFSKKDATVAVDYINPSWNKQAAISAKSYVEYVGGFSRQGLIDQLRYEGFTQKQAEYGVKAVGY